MPSSRPRHRRASLRTLTALVSAGALALALTACVGAPAPTPTPTPSSSADPIFASDEDALAAAEAAYERLLVASAKVTGSGGANVEPLNGVAIESALEAQLESAATYVEDGLHSEGQRTFSTYRLQSYEDIPGRDAVIAFYVCDDLRNLAVLDSNGASVVAPDRIVDVPYQVVVEGQEDDLVVSTKALWERENFCI